MNMNFGQFWEKHLRGDDFNKLWKDAQEKLSKKHLKALGKV